jgi:hypothetical protein
LATVLVEVKATITHPPGEVKGGVVNYRMQFDLF